MARHIVIVGLMGSGKSTVGRALAAELGRPFRDNDALLGKPAAEIGREDGMDALHRQEADVLLASLVGEEPAVIAAAASVVERRDARAALSDHFVVWLTADTATLAARHPSGAHRPAQDERSGARRAPLYGEVADLVIDTGVVDVVAAVNRIVVATSSG